MKKMFALLLICGLPALHAQKQSEVERQGEADLLLVKTKMRVSTLIVLPAGEEVSEVICGDTDYWVIEGRDNAVFIKPAKEGARTNVNIIAKSRAVYSFMVQEITKPGSKEKPDVKILLAGDEITKLRKDKEHLEELLTQQETTIAGLTGQSEDLSPKKKEMMMPRLWRMLQSLWVHM